MRAFWMGLFIAWSATGVAETSFSRPQSFTTTIFCSYQCRGEKPREQSLERIYSPLARGLRPGNGNLWGSLSHDFDAWTREWCLESAAQACHGEAKVADFSVRQAMSGTWIYDPNSVDTKAAILSPFDPHSGVTPALAAVPEDPGHALALSGSLLKKQGDDSGCLLRLDGKLRYGDCMISGGDIPTNFSFTNGDWLGSAPSDSFETLATRDSGGTSELTVCADAFAMAFRGKSLSAPVLRHYCELFYFNSVARDGQAYNSCAAARSRAQCDLILPFVR